MSQYQDIFDSTSIRTSLNLRQTNVPMRLERDISRQVIPVQGQSNEGNMPIYPEEDMPVRPTLSFTTSGNKPRNFAPELYVQALAAKSDLGLFDSMTDTAALDALQAYGSRLQSPHGSPTRKQSSSPNFSTQTNTDYHQSSISQIPSFSAIETRNAYKRSETDKSGSSNYNIKNVPNYGSMSQFQENVQPQYITVDQNPSKAKFRNERDFLYNELDDETHFSQGSAQHNQCNTPDSNANSFAPYKPLVELTTVDDEDEFLYGDSNPSVDTPISNAPAEKSAPQTIDIGSWSDDDITILDKEPNKLHQPDVNLTSKLKQSNIKKKGDLDESGIALKELSWTNSVSWKDDELNTLKSTETSLSSKDTKKTYDPHLEFCASITRSASTIVPKSTVKMSEKESKKISQVVPREEKKNIPPKKSNSHFLDSKYAAAADLLRKQLNLGKPELEIIACTKPREASFESTKQIPTNSGKRIKLATLDKPKESEALKVPNFVINVEHGEKNSAKRIVHVAESNVDLRNSTKSKSSVVSTQDIDKNIPASHSFETQRVVRDISKNVTGDPRKTAQDLPKHYMEPDCKKLDDKYSREISKGRSYSRSPRRKSQRRRSPSPDYQYRHHSSRFREHSSRNRSRSRPRPRFGRSCERSPRHRSQFLFCGRSPERGSVERRYRYDRSSSIELDETQSKKRSHSPEDLQDIDETSTIKQSETIEHVRTTRKPISFSIGSTKQNDGGLLKNLSSLDSVASVMHDLEATTPGQKSNNALVINELKVQERILVDLISLYKAVSQFNQLDQISDSVQEEIPFEEPNANKSDSFIEQPIDKTLFVETTTSVPQQLVPDLFVPPHMAQQPIPHYLSQVPPYLTQYSQPYPYNMQSFNMNMPPNFNFNPMFPPQISPTENYIDQQPPQPFPSTNPPYILPEVNAPKLAMKNKRSCNLKPIPILTPIPAFADDEEDQSTVAQKEPSKIKTIGSAQPRIAIEKHLKMITDKSPAPSIQDEKILVSRYQKLLEERNLIQKKLKNTSNDVLELGILKRELDYSAMDMRTSADKQILQTCQTAYAKANEELKRFIKEARDLNQEMQELKTKIRPESQRKIEVTEQKPTISTTTYSCYDTGNHWCKLCSVQFPTIPKMIEHFHSKFHIKHVDPFKCVAKKEPAKEAPGKNTFRHPAKGVEFITPLYAYYCSLCSESLLNQSFAEQHVKGHTHTVNYLNFIKENPMYVQKRKVFKDASIFKSVKEKRKKELEQLCLAKILIKEKQQKTEESHNKVKEMLLIEKQKEKPLEELDELPEPGNVSKTQVGVGIKLKLSNDKVKDDDEKRSNHDQHEKSKSEETKASRFKTSPSVIYIGRAPNFKPRLKPGDKSTLKAPKSKSDEQSNLKKKRSVLEENTGLKENSKETTEKNQTPSTKSTSSRYASNSSSEKQTNVKTTKSPPNKYTSIPSSEKQNTSIYPDIKKEQTAEKEIPSTKPTTTTYASIPSSEKEISTTKPTNNTYTSIPFKKQNASIYPARKKQTAEKEISNAYTSIPSSEKQPISTYPTRKEQSAKIQPKPVISGCLSQSEAKLASKSEVVESNQRKVQDEKQVLPIDIPMPPKPALIKLTVSASSIPLSQLNLPKTKPPQVKTVPVTEKPKPKTPLTEEEKDFFILGINKSDMVPIAVPRPPPHSLMPGHMDFFPKPPPFPPPLQVPPPSVVLQQSPALQSPYKPATISPLKNFINIPTTYNVSPTVLPFPNRQQCVPDKNLEVIDMEIDESDFEEKIILHKSFPKSSGRRTISNQSTISAFTVDKKPAVSPKSNKLSTTFVSSSNKAAVVSAKSSPSKKLEQTNESAPISNESAEVRLQCEEVVINLLENVYEKAVGATEITKEGKDVMSASSLDVVVIEKTDIPDQSQLHDKQSTKLYLDSSFGSDAAVPSATITITGEAAEHKISNVLESTDKQKVINKAVSSVLIEETSPNLNSSETQPTPEASTPCPINADKKNHVEVPNSGIPLNTDNLNLRVKVAPQLIDVVKDQKNVQPTDHNVTPTGDDERNVEPILPVQNVIKEQGIPDIKSVVADPANKQMAETNIKSNIVSKPQVCKISENSLPNVEEETDQIMELSDSKEIPNVKTTSDLIEKSDSISSLNIVSNEQESAQLLLDDCRLTKTSFSNIETNVNKRITDEENTPASANALQNTESAESAPENSEYSTLQLSKNIESSSNQDKVGLKRVEEQSSELITNIDSLEKMDIDVKEEMQGEGLFEKDIGSGGFLLSNSAIQQSLEVQNSSIFPTDEPIQSLDQNLESPISRTSSIKEADEPMDAETEASDIQTVCEATVTSLPQTLEEQNSLSFSSLQMDKQVKSLIQNLGSPNNSNISKIQTLCIEHDDALRLSPQILEDVSSFPQVSTKAVEAMEVYESFEAQSTSKTLNTEADKPIISAHRELEAKGNGEYLDFGSKLTSKEDEVLRMDTSETRNSPTEDFENEQLSHSPLNDSPEVILSEDRVEKNISLSDASINVENKNLVPTSSQDCVLNLEHEPSEMNASKQLEKEVYEIKTDNLSSSLENCNLVQSLEESGKNEIDVLELQPTNVEIEKPPTLTEEMFGEYLGSTKSAICEEVQADIILEKIENKQVAIYLDSLEQKSSNFEESNKFLGSMDVDCPLLQIKPPFKATEEAEDTTSLLETSANVAESSCDLSSSAPSSAVPFLKKFNTEDNLSSNLIDEPPGFDGPPVLSEFSQHKTESVENNFLIQNTDSELNGNMYPEVLEAANLGIIEKQNVASELHEECEKVEAGNDSDTDEYEAEENE